MYFSVIVPAYNMEPYLKTCVDSILAQTFRDFELILVDDGSSDETPVLCDAYAARDCRIRVIHQINQGVVRARQAGLLASVGQYILFVDGDDWIAPQLLARGKELIEETRAELILFAALREYKSYSESISIPISEGLYDKETLQAQLFSSLLLNAQMKHVSYSPNDKLFLRDLAEIGFLNVSSEIKLGEDLLSVFPIFLKAHRAYISHEVMNHFRVREQSASHSFQITYYQQVILVLEALKKLKSQSPSTPEDFDSQLDRYGAYMCFTLLVNAAHSGCRSYLPQIKEQMSRRQLMICIRQARFQGITAKTKITFTLFRKNMIYTAYYFLRLCWRMKNISKTVRGG